MAYYKKNKKKIRISIRSMKLKYNPHFHDGVEIVYMLDGESTVLVGKQEYTLRSGDMISIFPFQAHAYHNDVEPCRRGLMVFSLDAVPMFRNILLSNVPISPILHNANRFPELLSLIHVINEEYIKKDMYYNEAMQSYLSAFIAHMLRHIPIGPIGEQEFNTVQTILRYCSSHYREPLTLDQLSSMLHIHRSYISVVFSQRLHVTFNDYINSLRIDDACHLLRDTNDTVTAIATAVGFETIRTFNRAFQRVCGMTPSEYREMHHSKND